MEIIGVIIAGIIIGLLGKFVAPGDKDNIPIWLTIVCGIGGVLLGWYVYAAFGGGKTSGVDWVRWIVAVGCCSRIGGDCLHGHRPKHVQDVEVQVEVQLRRRRTEAPRFGDWS